MKKRKLKWAGEAKSDLKGIKQYIAQFAPRVATSYVRRIRERCLKLTTLPFAAPVVEEFQNERIRETYFGSYRILYHIGEKAVTILRFFHSARLLGEHALDDSSN
jgi:plasmid stabilization system protein ParE